MTSTTRARAVRLGLTSAAALIAVAILYRWDPAASSLFPRCLFLDLTGWTCPGCGSQRAVHALLRLEVAEALRMNAFAVCMIPVIAVPVVREAAALTGRRLPRVFVPSRLIWILLATILAFSAARNVGIWPAP